MGDTKETPSEKAKRLDSEGRCVVCGELHAKRKRGLCIPDYEKYRRAKAKLAVTDIPPWEAALVEAGFLLPDARSAADPFAAMATKMKLGQVIQLGKVQEKEVVHPLEISKEPDDDDVVGKIQEAVSERRKRTTKKAGTKKTAKQKTKRNSN